MVISGLEDVLYLIVKLTNAITITKNLKIVILNFFFHITHLSSIIHYVVRYIRYNCGKK